MSPPPEPPAVVPVRFPPPPSWSRELITVGVTGTNGKTSTTALIASALAEQHGPVPRVTTVGAFIDERRLSAPPSHQGFLAVMREGLDLGARFAAIEVTSEALYLGFAKAWPCQVGVFTNLTRDHLDAHGSAEHYLASKAQLFVHLPAGGVAVLNGCDPASELLAEVVPEGVSLLRYGAPSRGEPLCPVDLWAERVELGWSGTRVQVTVGEKLAGAWPADTPPLIELQAVGQVFAENALAALAAALGAGVEPRAALQGLARAPSPAGRFEVVAEGPHVVVDYAHTPDSLEHTLQSARALCEGRLWAVFGAGGDRDKAKRPQMGLAASTADHLVLTSDNPRGEPPAEIAAAIRDGVPSGVDVLVELDRAKAIERAVLEAGPQDVVLIAGKGHETEQIVAGAPRRFSDREVARAAWTRRGDG